MKLLIHIEPAEVIMIEVAGDKAQVIVANASGITCNNCGFINTDRVTLTTGKPIVAGGEVLAI